MAARDHGFAPQDLAVTVSCSDGSCASPGAVATVHASLTVQLPGMPGGPLPKQAQNMAGMNRKMRRMQQRKGGK